MSARRIIFATIAVFVAATASAQDRTGGGLLETGFTVANEAFAVRCNSAIAGCLSADQIRSMRGSLKAMRIS